MGGKTKQSQRTKNNARPSSSGRSAELLSGLGAGAALFPTLAPAAAFPALAPALAPALDPLLTPALQLCFKKLNKKDPITKTKALQELTELVVNSKVDDVVSALPSWSHCYKILSDDPDRKVREYTQSCHGAVVRACGRRAAPHLRRLVPAWLQARHDEHAPAAELAGASLQNTFPDNKLPEVLSFCKEEIVTHLIDMILGSGETAQIKKLEPAEQTAARARRAAGGLRALAALLARLPPAERGWLRARLDAPLRAPAFWQAARHAEPRVRAAWFECVGALVARFPVEFGAEHGARALRVLVGARERGAPPAARRWDCLLLFAHHVPDWHRYLERKESLGELIFDVLENGGWGDARHLSGTLLPLLAGLPDDMLTKEFLVGFFDALFRGLDRKSILNSKSERQAWVAGLAECLRFASGAEREFAPELVGGVLRAWLARALRPAPALAAEHVARLSAASLAALLEHWLRRARAGDERSERLYRAAWRTVGSALDAQVDRLPPAPPDAQRTMDAHVLLLRTLRTSFAQEARRQRSIKFEADASASEPAERIAPAEPRSPDPALAERYRHDREEAARDLGARYLAWARSEPAGRAALGPLASLLAEAGDAAFLGLARRFSCESPAALYRDVLAPGLAGDAMRCRELVDIVFMLMTHVPEREREDIFDTFEQFPSSVVEWCMALSLSHPHVSGAAARRWLRGAAVRGALRGLCARALDAAAGADADLLLMCLTNDHNGESMVSDAAVEETLTAVSGCLAPTPGAPLEARARLAARLAAARPHRALRAALWRLTATLQREDPRLSPETWDEARDAWLEGAPGPERAAFLRDAAGIAHRLLGLRSNFEAEAPSDAESPARCDDDAPPEPSDEDDGLQRGRTEHVAALCGALGRAARARLLAVARAPPLAVEAYAVRHYVLTGQLNCPLEEDDVMRAIANDELTELTREDLASFMTTCVFRTAYLRALRPARAEGEAEAEAEAEGAEGEDDLSDEEFFARELGLCVHDYTVLCALHDGYAFWPHYELIENVKSRLATLLDDIIEHTDEESRTRMSRALTRRATSEGYFWTYSAVYYETRAREISREKKGVSTTDGIEGEGSRDGTEGGAEKHAEPGGVSDEQTEGSAEPAEGSAEPAVGSAEPAEGSAEPAEGRVEPAEGSAEPALGSAETESGHAAFAVDDCLRNIDKGPAMINLLNYILARSSAPRSAPEAGGEAAYCAAAGSLYAAHAHEPAVAAAVRAAAAAGAGADLFVNTYYSHNHTMLYEKDVSGAAWAQAASNARLCWYLRERVARAGWELPAHVWDFTNIALCSLLASAYLSRERWDSAKVALLTRGALDLFEAVAPFVASVGAACERAEPGAAVAALPAEWRDIYAPDLNCNIFSLALHALERASERPPGAVGSCHVAVLDALTRALPLASWRALPAARRGGALAAERLAGAAAAALAAGAHPAAQLLAAGLLRTLREPLVLRDAEALAACSAAAEAGGAGAAPAELELSLRLYAPHLAGAGAGGGPRALGYLLLADALNAQCALARGPLAHHYRQAYGAARWAEPLLCVALPLLPSSALAGPAWPELAAHFAAPPPLRAGAARADGGALPARLACRALWWSARGAGAAAARGWRHLQPRATAALLDQVTARYITPAVVKEEFSLLQKRSSEIEDAEVTMNWSSYEVSCVLTVDDNPIELVVSLSRSHPLLLPKLSALHSAAGNINWILMYLGYQNGTILNALKMWCASVNSKLEKAPQCYICYCRLHHATGRLPTVHCHTCHNKFHSVCLRKWFLSSSKMTCPLCRANF